MNNSSSVSRLSRSARAYVEVTRRVPMQFRLAHIAGFLLLFPLVLASRVWPSRWRGESVFKETNRSVLTALGIASNS